MKNNSRIAVAGLSVLAIVFFAGKGYSIAKAQAAGAIMGDFKHDVEQGVQEIKNDVEAQNNQHEIDNEDTEQAGDQHGDAKEIDGEHNQDEIDNQIEQEVEHQEASGDQADGGTASSSDSHGD